MRDQSCHCNKVFHVLPPVPGGPFANRFYQVRQGRGTVGRVNALGHPAEREYRRGGQLRRRCVSPVGAGELRPR